MRGWRCSPRVAVFVIAAFAVAQLAIPVSRFGGPDTDRFAWQMFSTYAPDPGFVVEVNGGRITIDLETYMARARADIPITDLLPEHLCAVIPDAVRVTWNEGVEEC